jgi:hypothetical protein
MAFQMASTMDKTVTVQKLTADAEFYISKINEVHSQYSSQGQQKINTITSAKSGEKISPEFTALGVLLLTLYENLQVTDQAYNVREAFLNAHRKAQTIREGGQA